MNRVAAHRHLGLMLSLWDWMAGTLYVPREREDFQLGLTGASTPSTTACGGSIPGPW